MIDIPIGKALVAVEAPMLDKHANCFFSDFYPGPKCNLVLACMPITRKDGKSVIFKLVDYPTEDK